MKRQWMFAAAILLLASAAGAATVRGRVVYGGGKPCVGAAVTVVNGSKQSTEAYTDTQGMFYLRNVPAGRYTLNVKTNRGTKSMPITVGAAEYSDAPAVTVE